MANKKTGLAEDRTDWAEDRTILANERTYAGWLRTGMACIALALGLRALFGDADLSWHPGRIVASLFCLVAVLIFWAAWRKSCKTLARMSEHAATPLTDRSMTLVTLALSFGALGTLCLLWII